MSNTNSIQQKSKGNGKVLGAKIKREADRVQSSASQAAARAKKDGARLLERAKGKAQQVSGSIEHGVGRAMKNEKIASKGRAKRVAAEDRQNRGR